MIKIKQLIEQLQKLQYRNEEVSVTLYRKAFSMDNPGRYLVVIENEIQLGVDYVYLCKEKVI